ncbi:MAG: hypothetical protein LOY00_08655, partial [Methylocaldum sp.]|nr:hypothetical protein [Methylocaldum sp.]
NSLQMNTACKTAKAIKVPPAAQAMPPQALLSGNLAYPELSPRARPIGVHCKSKLEQFSWGRKA